MIFYSWTALSDGNPPSGQTSVAMGITDDRGRAMRAGEETLGSGRALMVIIEAVRPAMAAQTLAPCYVRTGVGWRGRRASSGEVDWERFFVRIDPADTLPPYESLAGWDHEAPDLH
jgi:hypothetical protein